jgi:hypothetical protein
MFSWYGILWIFRFSGSRQIIWLAEWVVAELAARAARDCPAEKSPACSLSTETLADISSLITFIRET